MAHNGMTGFWPVGQRDGDNDLTGGHLYPVTAAVNTALDIYLGDLVIRDATGTVTPWTTDTTNLLGSVMAIFDTNMRPLLGTTRYLTKATAGYVLVYDDPLAVFQCEVASGGTLTLANRGDQFDPVVTTAAYNANTAISGMQLSGTAAGNGAQKQFTLQELLDKPDNATGDSFQQALVIPNKHYRISGQNVVA